MFRKTNLFGLMVAFLLSSLTTFGQLTVNQVASSTNHQMIFTGTNYNSVPSNLRFPMVEFKRDQRANFSLKNTSSTGGRLEIGIATTNGDFTSTSKPGDVVFRALNAQNSLTFAIPASVDAVQRPIRFVAQWKEIMTIMSTGKVGIGVEDSYLDEVPWASGDQRYRLYVRDGIRTEKVKIDAKINWPDYVFQDTYELKPLNEVEQFINTNSHLPEVPSAKEIATNGIDVAEMNAVLLRKIEELTLYVIEQDKRLQTLETENKTLKRQ